MKRLRLSLLSFFFASGISCLNAGEAAPATEKTGTLVPFVEVKTKKALAPHNTNVRVYFRPPNRYDPASTIQYRVLVYFGGRNCSGEREAAGKQGDLKFDTWADAHNIFIVAPGFKDDDYWLPEK
jgi:hypothetical protein